MKAENKEPKKKPVRPWKTFLIVNALGIDFVVCVLAGFFLGSYIQRLTGSVLWMVAGLLLGIAAGVWSVILLIKKFMEGADG
ncbi:AtpZ/AtpI family protein [Paenibacillus alkalitolerans]|uniref:AtpZ/AtpI family protein n=1 Tax=Paenibacillus alkalitolerans TaxID=2799335 RepID=UPI0018F5C36E|nr:AtpZ/AtpI family protein [Paenibacillus alkalitolerans]